MTTSEFVRKTSSLQRHDSFKMRKDDTSETSVQSKLHVVTTRKTETFIYISIAIRTLSLTKYRLFKENSIPWCWSAIEAASQRSPSRGSTTRSYYRGADKSLARPTSRCILFDGENISFDASLVIYI